MMLKDKKYILGIVIGLMSACSLLTDPEASTNAQDPVVINNNTHLLSSRIEYFNAAEAKIVDKNAVQIQSGVTFKHRATIRSLSHHERTLHAVHITIEGDHAYVAYSTPEKPYRGAVEIVDISDLLVPRIISQAFFVNTDINVAVRDGDHLYVGGAVNSDLTPLFKTPAVVSMLPLRNHFFTGGITQIDLRSFNANDIMIDNHKLYVTSGTSDGTLSIIDKTLTDKIEISVHGAKAVGRYKNKIVVLEGTGTNLHIFDALTNHLLKRIPLGCVNVFQAKAELEIHDGLAFLSSGPCGMKVVDLESDNIVYELEYHGKQFCNAVSVNDDLIFLANGSRGLSIARIENDEINVLGSLRISIPMATNFVTAKGNALLIAAGEAGLLILEINGFNL